MSSYQHSDFGVSSQSTDNDDHFTVTLAPYNHSSNVSLKLPDSDSGLQGSSKATGSLKNSLSSTDGEDLQDGDEESSRGAFSYFPSGEARKLVTISNNTHNFDECVDVDSDKSSIESPRSDGSSTQEYEVTQPDECELQDMSSRSAKYYDEYRFSEDSPVMDSALENIHKELYGQQRSLPAFFSSSAKMERGSACVDASVEFNLGKSSDAARYSRYGSEGYHQPPFGDGTKMLQKVGRSIGDLISPHPGAVENMPAGEEIKQNGGLDSDGRKRKKKKKPSAGGQDDANAIPVLSLGPVDINGNPKQKVIRDITGWPERETAYTESLNSSKPKSYGATKETGKDSFKESSKDSSKPEATPSGSSSDQGAVTGSDGKSIKRKRQKKEPVVRAEEIENYHGDGTIEEIVNYVNGHSSGKKSGKKTLPAAAPVGKVTEKSESLKKGKAIHSPNDFGDEDSPVSVGVGNMGNSANKSLSNEESSVMSEQASEVVEVSEEARSLVRPLEQVAVEEISDLQKNKNKSSTKQTIEKHGENNNVKKPGNKTEAASKPNKKVEKEGPIVGVNKKIRTVAEPFKEEEFPTVTSPAAVDAELSSDKAYIFTDIDSLHQSKMEEDFLTVTNKKKRQRSLVKEPIQPYQNNYHPKDKFHFSPRTASPPLVEGGMGDKSNSYDFSPAGFPGLPKKGGTSQKSGYHHVRRNSIGEVPVDPSKQLQDDSDIESVKSLPVGQLHQGGWMESQRPLSYAKITASKPEGSGSTTEGARGTQKPTVWKGSLTERRHSIGSKPEKLKQDSDGSGDLRSRHKSGSQEVLKTDDKECSAVSRNQTEPALATADGLRDSGLLAPNSETDFPCLPASSTSLVKSSETKPQPPVSQVQSSQHSSGQNSEGAPPHTSAATAPPLVKPTNSVAVARSPNTPVVSSASDTTSAGARSQLRSGEAADVAQDHKRSKATVARVPNNGRKPQPVFFCDMKGGNEPQNLDITFGYDSSIDDVRPAPRVLQQQGLNSSQGVSFGLEQGDGPDAPIFTATNPNLGVLSPPPPPHSQPSRGVSDSSKAKLGRMNGVVPGACKHLEASVSMARVPPPAAPMQAALGMGRGMPGVGQMIPGVPPMLPGFPPHLIPTMPHMMPLIGQTMVGQGVPGMVTPPMLPSVGQNLPGMLPGAAAVGLGGHVIPSTGAQAAHGHVMGHVVGHKGQGTLRRVEYGALAEPTGGTRKFIVYYEIPESKGNFNLEEAAAFLQQMYDRDVMAQKQGGSMGMNRQDN